MFDCQSEKKLAQEICFLRKNLLKENKYLFKEFLITPL